MDIVVLGATGGTGRLVVERALAEGHRVTAVVRSTGHPPFPAGVTVVEADVTDAGSLAAAVAGADAVIGTLGATGGTLMQDSTSALISATAGGGPSRFVLLSGYSQLGERLTRPARLMASTVMKAMATDKAASEDLLRSSDMDWTIVYATRLTNGPASGRTRVVGADEKVGIGQSVSRTDVAGFLVAAASDRAMSRREVVIAG